MINVSGQKVSQFLVSGLKKLEEHYKHYVSLHFEQNWSYFSKHFKHKSFSIYLNSSDSQYVSQSFVIKFKKLF